MHHIIIINATNILYIYIIIAISVLEFELVIEIVYIIIIYFYILLYHIYDGTLPLALPVVLTPSLPFP